MARHGGLTPPLVLADANWHGAPHKLLIQANRNGFFYIFDRRDGKLLLAKSFVKKITWAKEIGADGKPVVQQMPKVGAGTRVCRRAFVFLARTVYSRRP